MKVFFSLDTKDGRKREFGNLIDRKVFSLADQTYFEEGSENREKRRKIVGFSQKFLDLYVGGDKMKEEKEENNEIIESLSDGRWKKENNDPQKVVGALGMNPTDRTRNGSYYPNSDSRSALGSVFLTQGKENKF